MKITIHSLDSGTRWNIEVDADKHTVMDLLDSEEWQNEIEIQHMSEDWNRKGKGYDVFDVDDDDILVVVGEIKLFLEEQGLDVIDVQCIETLNEDEDTDEYSDSYDDDEEWTGDLYEECFSGEDNDLDEDY
jgi:hypothetical protein